MSLGLNSTYQCLSDAFRWNVNDEKIGQAITL